MSQEDLKEQEKIDLVVSGENDSSLQEKPLEQRETLVSKNSASVTNSADTPAIDIGSERKQYRDDDTISEELNHTLLLDGDSTELNALDSSDHSSGAQTEHSKDGANDDSMVGKVIAGKFQILLKLGEGGMSVVYKAKHLLLNQRVAIKMVHPGQMQHKVIARLQQEAKAATTLSHNNIATVREFGIDENCPYLVMDFVDGISLENEIKKQGTLSPERTKEIISQVCAGLEHAHKSKVVHRDLKPGNIILTKDANGVETAKIVDFGIAKIVDEENEANLTQTGEVFGTPNYMSPEQCMGKKADARSDIYSLGCIMYECLMGRSPFESESALTTLMSHVKEPFEMPKKSPSNDLMKAIKFCLEKDPQDRWQTADDLGQFLQDPNGPISKKYKSQERHFTKRQIFTVGITAAILAATVAVYTTLAPLTPIVQEYLRPKPWMTLAHQSDSQAALGPANYPTAMVLIDKAIKQAEDGGASNSEMESLYTRKGHLLSNANQNQAACLSLIKALEYSDKHAVDFNRGSIYDWLAQCYLEEKNYLPALDNARKAVDIKTQTVGENNQLTLLSEFRLGQAYRGMKDFSNAEKVDQKLVKQVTAMFPKKDDLLVSDAYHQLANILADMGKPDQAIENYKKSLEIVSTLLGKESERTKKEVEFLLQYLRTHNRAAETEQIIQRYK